MSDLKPCPFCGGVARVYRYTIGDCNPEDQTTIECDGCAAEGPTFSHEDAETKAVKAWNTRADHLPGTKEMINPTVREIIAAELADRAEFFRWTHTLESIVTDWINLSDNYDGLYRTDPGPCGCVVEHGIACIDFDESCRAGHWNGEEVGPDKPKGG